MTIDTTIMLGSPVAQAIKERAAVPLSMLQARGVVPRLMLIRCGQNAGDVSYEKSILKKAAAWGLDTVTRTLPANVTTDQLAQAVGLASADETIDGIMLFRPLPRQIDADAVMAVLARDKDVDGMTPASQQGLVARDPRVNLPATAAAAVALLRHYEIGLAGASAVVVGRSLVVGRPLAQLLMDQDATVTVCHSHTVGLREMTVRADVVVAALGRANYFDAGWFGPRTAVVDVGINDDGQGGVCGDVDTDAVIGHVRAVNPVYKGLGTDTTSILLAQCVAGCADRHG